MNNYELAEDEDFKNAVKSLISNYYFENNLRFSDTIKIVIEEYCFVKIIKSNAIKNKKNFLLYSHFYGQCPFFFVRNWEINYFLGFLNVLAFFITQLVVWCTFFRKVTFLFIFSRI